VNNFKIAQKSHFTPPSCLESMVHLIGCAQRSGENIFSRTKMVRAEIVRSLLAEDELGSGG